MGSMTNAVVVATTDIDLRMLDVFMTPNPGQDDRITNVSLM